MKGELTCQMITMLRAKVLDLSEEEQEVIKQAEAAPSEYEMLKQEMSVYQKRLARYKQHFQNEGDKVTTQMVTDYKALKAQIHDCQIRITQYKRSPWKKRVKLMKELVRIVHSKDMVLNKEEKNVIEQAEVSIIDCDTLKEKVLDPKSTDNLYRITKDYKVVRNFLKQREVWLKAFNYKHNKATLYEVVRILHQHKRYFKDIDYNKIAVFLTT